MAITIPEITAIIRNVLRDPGIDITPATHFDDLTDWDAMDLVSVIVEIECRCGLQFEVYEIDRLATVSDLVNMVLAKQALATA